LGVTGAATLGGRFGGYGLFLSQSNNRWLRSTPLKVVIWGLLILGLLLAWIARSKRWTGWKGKVQDAVAKVND
jgi:hypothetical protein